MKTASLATVLTILPLVFAPARAAEDPGIARLATCQDSWLDWQKTDPARMKNFADHFRAAFAPNDNGAFFVPKSNLSVLGFHVTQVYPESVGMGVGFSVLVEAPFDKARRSLEKSIGRPLGKCETSDNMRTCGLELGEKRTLMAMAEDSPKATTTLLGCYYYYEK
jgi:hypothetical protein